MLKRAEIKEGETVTWRRLIDPQLEYVACLDAKVIELKADRAIIVVRKSNVINAPTVEYSVDITDLESKTLIRDEEKYAKRKADRLAAAQVVTSEECECLIEDDGEKYFYDIEEYLEDCEDNDREPDAFLWACKLVPINRRFDADDFEGNIIDQYGEDADVKGLDELQQAIDRFYEANTHLKSVETDYTRVVLVPKNNSTAE